MRRGGSFSTAQASAISGLSLRQIDYLDSHGFVHPSLMAAKGSGTFRRYSGEDVDHLVLIAKLLKAGVSWERIKRDRNPAKTAEDVRRAMMRVLEVVA